MQKLLLLAGLALVATVIFSYVISLFARVTYMRAIRHRPFRCPHCGGTDVRPSYPAGFPDGFFARFACFPFRCRACSCRFFRAKT